MHISIIFFTALSKKKKNKKWRFDHLVGDHLVVARQARLYGLGVYVCNLAVVPLDSTQLLPGERMVAER